ncbi:MAG: class I SAM-dependent methyltransferase [Bacteroidales bacterium]|nr:class I SAM-dependent methyltransferase [Bacteroidales bacterium]
MKIIRFIIRFIKYYFSAKTKYDIHSPFVFNLITKVLTDKKKYDDYYKAEEIRNYLLNNNQRIIVNDFGAGLSSELKSAKKIKTIAKHSAKSPKYAKVLYCLVKYFQPRTILELGTSLGISAIYQSLAAPESKFITIEGCPNIAGIAKQNFNKLNLKNIELIVGKFDDVLQIALSKYETLDYIFFDGNHKKEATIKYFEQCIPLINNNTLFVFDDIHWSKEMEEAWEQIKKNPLATITIDIFFMGFVFFRKELTKQDFIIRF